MRIKNSEVRRNASHFRGIAMQLLRNFSVFAILAPFFFIPTIASAAPSQLYNKSIELHWGESFVSKRVSDGTPSTGIGRKSRVIYISSAGRAFVKASDISGRSGSTRERGPEDTRGNVSFSGSQLLFVGVNQQIARRVVVSFDPSFSSCTAELTVGKTGANARAAGYDGAAYEVISITGGPVSCSVKQGNAVGGQ